MAPTDKSPRKTGSKKPSATKTGKDGRKKVQHSTLLKSLPESVENIEIVQQVACVLEELQKRVLDVKVEASKELKKLMKRYESNYKGLEKKVHAVTSDAKKQAQTSMIHLLQKWHEHKEKLPTPVAKEIEKIVEQIGAKVVARTAAAKKTAPKTTKNTNSSVKKKAPASRVTKSPKAAASKRRTASSSGSEEISAANL